MRSILKSDVAVLVGEGTSVNVAEELTNSLLDHIHNQVVEVESEESSFVVSGNEVGGGLGLRISLDSVDGGEDNSHEATEEGSHEIPGLVTSAS